MAYDIITVTPTLSTSAYTDPSVDAGNIVLFVSTEVKLPASSCKLFNMQCIFNDTQSQEDRYNIFFFQENTNNVGSLRGAVDITADEISANGFLGVRKLIHDDATIDAHLGDPSLMVSGGAAGDGNAEYFGPFEDLILKSGTTKDTIYMQGIIEASGGLACAADDMVITLHVEY